MQPLSRRSVALLATAATLGAGSLTTVAQAASAATVANTTSRTDRSLLDPVIAAALSALGPRRACRSSTIAALLSPTQLGGLLGAANATQLNTLLGRGAQRLAADQRRHEPRRGGHARRSLRHADRRPDRRPARPAHRQHARVGARRPQHDPDHRRARHAEPGRAGLRRRRPLAGADRRGARRAELREPQPADLRPHRSHAVAALKRPRCPQPGGARQPPHPALGRQPHDRARRALDGPAQRRTRHARPGAAQRLARAVDERVSSPASRARPRRSSRAWSRCCRRHRSRLLGNPAAVTGVVTGLTGRATALGGAPSPDAINGLLAQVQALLGSGLPAVPGLERPAQRRQPLLGVAGLDTSVVTACCRPWPACSARAAPGADTTAIQA